MQTNKRYENGAVSLTFDDGSRSAYDNALPLLEEAGIKSTHYVISGFLDDPESHQCMDIDQLRTMQQKGHEIGCHTTSHKCLTQETKSTCKEEIIDSRRSLQNLGFSIETFAYPYGKCNERVVSIVKQAGFLGARTTKEGYNNENTDPLLLECQTVGVNTTRADVRPWIGHAQATHSWLILMFHQVDHEGQPWSTTPETLKAILEYLLLSKIRIITVREGL